jgi:hypothetical protein
MCVQIIVGAKSNDEHRCISDVERSGYESAHESWMNWHSDVWINAVNYIILATPVAVAMALAFFVYRRCSRPSPTRGSQIKKGSKTANAKRGGNNSSGNNKKKAK